MIIFQNILLYFWPHKCNFLHC